MRLRDAIILMLVTLLAGCAGATRLAEEHKTSPLAEQHLALGQQYLEKGMYEVALENLQKAVRADPRSADAHSMLGLLYERIRRPAKAGEHYERAVALEPERGAILNNHGAWLCRSGRAAEADEYFLRALDDPFYRTPLAALSNAGACAMAAGSPEKAEAYFRRVLEIEPTHADALYEMAMLSYGKGDLMRARAFAQRRLAIGNVPPEMLELAARIEDGLGDNGAASRYRVRLRTEFPEYRSSTPESPTTP